MEILNDFVDNYKGSLQGLNVVAKILVTLALVLIIFAILGAIVNVVAHNL